MHRKSGNKHELENEMKKSRDASTAEKLNTPSPGDASQIDASGKDRLEIISAAAYYKAQARGFIPGQELQDWLEAEAEVEKPEALR